MNTKATPELSYFRLKLTAYLRDHQPDLVDDATFVSSRSDAASPPMRCSAQGVSHPEAESMPPMYSLKVCISQSMTPWVSVLENEFEAELPSPLPEKLAPILLRNKAVQRVFANYNLTDDFAASPQYEDLYTELTGTIVLIIEQNNLPTVEGANAVE